MYIQLLCKRLLFLLVLEGFACWRATVSGCNPGSSERTLCNVCMLFVWKFGGAVIEFCMASCYLHPSSQSSSSCCCWFFHNASNWREMGNLEDTSNIIPSCQRRGAETFPNSPSSFHFSQIEMAVARNI